jgi:hypothetical protein
MKTTKDIEALLQWTYLDELPKRKTSSAEGIWDRLSQYGSLGGINPDPGHGAAQRYPHFGLPHKDAELIEAAVNVLADTVIDWRQHYELLAADLAPLVSINDARAADTRMAAARSKASFDPAGDGRGTSTRVDRPRDVILVNTIRTEALVYLHAVKGTRPAGWRVTDMRPVPTVAERGGQTKIIGICKGKSSYTSGSYCPLRWDPSPLKIVLARARYFAWHQALCRLVAVLNLTEHEAMAPAANSAPWIDGEIAAALFAQPPDRSSPLPLKPRRRAAGPPPEKPRKTKARRVKVDRGNKSAILSSSPKRVMT